MATKSFLFDIAKSRVTFAYVIQKINVFLKVFSDGSPLVYSASAVTYYPLARHNESQSPLLEIQTLLRYAFPSPQFSSSTSACRSFLSA